MIEAKDISLGGVTYRVAQLPATKALKLSHQLARILGPALLRAGAAIDRKGGKLLESKIDFGQLSDAADLLFRNCDEVTFESIVKTVLTDQLVMVQGATVVRIDPAMFELQFAGQMKTLFRLIAFALEVNFADFFDDLRPLLAALQAKAAAAKAAASGSPQASTSNAPPSGESLTPA